MGTANRANAETLRADLDRMIRAADAAAAKIRDDVDTLNALSWADGPASDLALGGLARTVYAIRERDTNDDATALPRAVRRIVERETSALLRDEYRGSSSGAFPRAVESAKRDAAARFVEYMGKVV